MKDPLAETNIHQSVGFVDTSLIEITMFVKSPGRMNLLVGVCLDLSSAHPNTLQISGH
jgi:hypothetical protein